MVSIAQSFNIGTMAQPFTLSSAPQPANAIQSSEMGEIAAIKQECDHELVEVTEEQKILEKKLQKLKHDCKLVRERIDAKRQEFAQLQVKLIEAEQRSTLYEERVHHVKQTFENVRKNVADDLSMEDFHKEALSLTKTYLDAMQFYSEDKLTIELKKKEKEFNEKRVEYTKVESMYNSKLDQFQRKKEDLEKQRLNNVDRQKKLEAMHQEKMREDEERYERQAQFQSALSESKVPGKPFIKPRFRENQNKSVQPNSKNPTEEDSHILSQALAGNWSSYKTF